MIFTTTFVPNDLQGTLAGYAGAPRIARAGGVRRSVEGTPPDAITVFDTNVTGWYGSAPSTALVGAARKISLNLDIKWRGMFRFLLRENTIDQSSILSGSPPQPDWWQYVTSVEFKWFNGDPGAPEAGTPPDHMDSDLLIYGGRGLHTVTGGIEGPFGRNQTEGATDYGAATVFGPLVTTLAYADWALPTRTYKSLFLPASIITTYFNTVTGDADAYFDIAFQVFKEGVEGINFKQEFAAYGGFQPMLIVTFDIPSTPGGQGSIITVITDSASVNVTGLLGGVSAFADTSRNDSQADTGRTATQAGRIDVDAMTCTGVAAFANSEQTIAQAHKGDVSISAIPFAVDAYLDGHNVTLVAEPSGAVTLTVPL